MLFKDKNKLIQYAALDSNINFNVVKSTIETVEEEELLPLIGQELYEYILDVFTNAANEDALEETEKKLLHKCRRLIGPMVCFYFGSIGDVNLSEAGMRRLETNTNKTAFQEQRTKFLEQNLRRGEIASESLIKFLEENKIQYPLWTESSTYKKYRKLFIKTGKEFNDYFPTSSPYRNYMAMRSNMFEVEENIIRKVTGSVLFDGLKEKDESVAPPFTEADKVLLEKIKFATAYLTVARSIPYLNIRIDVNGFTVASSNRTTNDDVTSRNAAADNSLSLLLDSCKHSSEVWVQNIKNYLNDPENEGAFDGWPIVAVKKSCDDGVRNCNENNSGSFMM